MKLKTQKRKPKTMVRFRLGMVGASGLVQGASATPLSVFVTQIASSPTTLYLRCNGGGLNKLTVIVSFPTNNGYAIVLFMFTNFAYEQVQCLFVNIKSTALRYFGRSKWTRPKRSAG